MRDLDPRNLAEELARRIRGAVRRIEDGIGRIACAKLQAIVALQLLPLNAFPVDERTVLAALIDEEKPFSFENDQRVIARNSWIGDHQILIDLTAHAERSSIEDDVLLLVTLHQHQRGKHAGTRGLRTAYRIQDHGMWRHFPNQSTRKQRE